MTANPLSITSGSASHRSRGQAVAVIQSWPNWLYEHPFSCHAGEGIISIGLVKRERRHSGSPGYPRIKFCGIYVHCAKSVRRAARIEDLLALPRLGGGMTH